MQVRLEQAEAVLFSSSPFSAPFLSYHNEAKLDRRLAKHGVRTKVTEVKKRDIVVVDGTTVLSSCGLGCGSGAR